MSNSHFPTFFCNYGMEPKKSAEVFYERFPPCFKNNNNPHTHKNKTKQKKLRKEVHS